MADIDQIRLSNGTTYTIKDATSRTDSATAKTQEEFDRQLACGVYPGRALTSIPEIAAEISSAGNVYAFLHNRARAANFANIRIGDYFDVPVTGYGTVRYRIGGVDTYYQCGDTAMGHHFLCVPLAPVTMPASSEYTTNGSYIMWNTTADNNGTAEESSPYLASNLHAWEINEFLPALPSALQGYLLERRDLVEVRYSASAKLTASTGWKWASLGKVWSLSEMEVYGCNVWGTPGHSQGLGDKLPIFQQTKDRIKGGRVDWWLRVVSGSSASDVCGVSYSGGAGSNSAAYARVRALPCFLLG